MAAISSIIAQGLELAGNTSLDPQNVVLPWLQNFLQHELRHKYPWQRKTVTFTTTAGVVFYNAQPPWDPQFLDIYTFDDGTSAFYTDPTQNPQIQIPFQARTFRQYFNLRDRLTAQGQPRYIVPDIVNGGWYVYPVPDKGYSITVNYYWLEPPIGYGATSIWSTYAPEEILVKAVEVSALFHQDDARFLQQYTELMGQPAQGIPGMLQKYRRRELAKEGVTHGLALDRRIFRAMDDDATVYVLTDTVWLP